MAVKTVETSANSFGTFLETVHSRREGKGEPRVATGTMKILELLEESTETVPELISRSGMQFEQFMRAFAATREAGLILLKKSDDKEIVELTATGSQVIKLAHE